MKYKKFNLRSPISQVKALIHEPKFIIYITILLLLFLLYSPELRIFVAATPYVYIPETYNVSYVQVSAFLVDNKVIVRANVTDSAPGTDPVTNATLNITNPSGGFNVYQQNMTTVGSITNGYIFEWNYTLNSTDTSGTYKVNVTGTDSAGSTAKNSTTFTVTAGLLVVNLTTPSTSSTTNVYQYNTFDVTANVTCLNGNCGNVYGTVRYNKSSVNPDTAINSTTGATPFYNTSGAILQSCGSMNKDQTCQLNWTVNATGAIDSAYKIGVLFNSSYSSVTQNHTNNATVQIVGGRLEVNLTYPPIGTTNVDQNSTFNVNATITCRNGNCGNVYGTVRYNASSANPDTAINSTEGATPLYIISSNNIRPISYSTSTSGDGTITGSPSDGYDDGYNDTSTYLTVYAFTSGSATVNYSYSLTSNLAILFATLRGSTSGTGEYVQLYNFTSNNWYDWLVEPSTITTIYSVPVNTTSGLIKSDGTLILRLNATTGSGPSVEFDDTYVNYISNLISCGSLSKDQSCQLNWTVNATGTPISEYKIGVLFNSSYTTVTQNHTNNVTIKIIECTEAYTIRWNTIDFGDLNPNTTNNNATGNNNQTYNISNTGTCNLKVWLKGTDLQNTTAREPSNVIHIIGVGNITWQNVTNNPSGAYALTKDYVILNSSFTQAIKNITTYYWLTVPPIPAGPYNGSITYCANTTQQSGLTGSC